LLFILVSFARPSSAGASVLCGCTDFVIFEFWSGFFLTFSSSTVPLHPTCTAPRRVARTVSQSTPRAAAAHQGRRRRRLPLLSFIFYLYFTCRRACLSSGVPPPPRWPSGSGSWTRSPPPLRFEASSLELPSARGGGGDSSPCPFPSRSRGVGLGARALGVLPLRRGRLRRRRRIGVRPSASSSPPSALGLDCCLCFVTVYFGSGGVSSSLLCLESFVFLPYLGVQICPPSVVTNFA
jgi:hypothetical protein